MDDQLEMPPVAADAPAKSRKRCGPMRRVTAIRFVEGSTPAVDALTLECGHEVRTIHRVKTAHPERALCSDCKAGVPPVPLEPRDAPLSAPRPDWTLGVAVAAPDPAPPAETPRTLSPLAALLSELGDVEEVVVRVDGKRVRLTVEP